MVIKHNKEVTRDIIKYFPILNYRIKKDYVTINGKRHYYTEDNLLTFMCKKKGRGYEYVPCFGESLNSVGKNDFFVDGSPYIIIGLANIMMLSECIDDNLTIFGSTVSRIVKEHLKGKDFSEVVQNVNKIRYSENNMGLTELLANFETLRGTNVNASNVRVRRFVYVMLYLYLFQVRDFYETLFTLIEYIQDIIELEIVGKSFGKEAMSVLEIEDYRDCLNLVTCDYKKYSYKFNDRSYSITNADGLSVSMLFLFYLHVYKKYAVCSSTNRSVICDDEKYKCTWENVQANIRHCVGTDLSAVFITRRVYGFKDLNATFKSCLELCEDRGNIPKIRDKGEQSVFRYEGEVVPRDIYESFVLGRKASKNYSRPIIDMHRNMTVINTYYFHIQEFRAIMGSILILTNTGVSDEDDSSKQLDLYESKIKQLETEVKTLKSTIKDYEDKDSIIEDLNNKLEDANRILESKTNIIGNLTEEVQSLNEKLSSFYSDEVFEEEIKEDEISIEGKIEFLNDFKILLLGGKSNLINKLEDLGITNMIQETNQNKFQNTVASVDFIVLNTDFISHKLVFTAKERNKDKSDCIIYYKGTSPTGLIKACYDFINKWLN